MYKNKRVFEAVREALQKFKNDKVHSENLKIFFEKEMAKQYVHFKLEAYILPNNSRMEIEKQRLEQRCESSCQFYFGKIAECNCSIDILNTKIEFLTNYSYKQKDSNGTL